MRRSFRVLLLGFSHLCALVGGVGGALLVGEPVMDPLAGLALSWGRVSVPQDVAEETLEERLRDHGAYVSQLVSHENGDILLLGQLVAFSALAALPDGSDRNGYLKRAEQACLRLEWDDCTEGVLIETGEKQLRGKLQP